MVFISNDAQETVTPACQTCTRDVPESVDGINVFINITKVGECLEFHGTLSYPSTHFKLAWLMIIDDKGYAVTPYFYYNVSAVYMCNDKGQWEHEINGTIAEGQPTYNYFVDTDSNSGCNAGK
ncbi:unnamed protein product [Caenorhabditis nigoni]